MTLNVLEDLGEVMGTRNKFKDVNETFKIFTLFLTSSMMYPNPRSDRRRTIGACVVAMVYLPQLGFMLWDMVLRIQLKDIENLVRQMTVTLVVSFGIVKVFLTVIGRNKFRAILDRLNSDFVSFNHLPEEYQDIVTENIAKLRKLEKLWIFMSVSASFSFPVLACILTIYSQFTDEPRRYMVHESFMPFIDEVKYDTPYYEIQIAYSMCVVLLIVIGYTAFDGMFYVIVLHVSLKIKLYSRKMTHLMDDRHVPTIRAKIVEVVKEQCQVFSFIEEVQSYYEYWLANIFFLAVAQIAMTLSQTTTDSGSQTKIIYVVFAAAASINIFIPCYVTSEVTSAAAEVSNCIYACNWECVSDSGVRRSICIMLARSQIPTYFQAYQMITFNMEMFVSIMQTAYSMYTLLRS